MGLREYRKKRDFTKTREPRGKKAVRHDGLQFVIQKHVASHLHYDFRLELEGVLKSWAVPKGPDLDPSQKRLAMQVEDHPLEYGSFEGIIPKGEYGGGTVMLWDQGTWEPLEDPKKGYREGHLKFQLHGKKLQGGWMLVRKGGKHAAADERHWFLFKERDQYAGAKRPIVESKPLSVVSGRDLDEIAKQANRVWGPNGEISKNGRAKDKTAKKNRRGSGSSSKKSAQTNHPLVGAPTKKSSADRAVIAETLKRMGGTKRVLPSKASVQLATLTKDAPDGNDWIHEIKFDGYRMLCRVDGDKVRFISRNGLDWTAKFPELAAAAQNLSVASAILDGEVVVMQPDGTTSFQALQNAFQTAHTADFQFYVFDLLYLNGYDLREATIEDRKARLKEILPAEADQPFKYSEHVVGNGAKFFAEAARLHLEGIISKRLGRPYTAGRGIDWLKVKCSLQEEFVIGGFTTPTGSRQHFGALLLGYYDTDKKLIYAGRVGTGFDDRTLADLHAKMKRLVRPKSAFANLSGNTGQARGVTWLEPELVAQIVFSNWTNDRQLRHPSFQGLREDKAAKEIMRDDPVSAPTVHSARKAAKMPKEKPSPKSSKQIRAGLSSTADQAPDIAGVHLSHPDKVLYPEDKITKLDLAKYYEQVASWMLPHVKNRLLSLVRCPAGSGQKCFFQKHPGDGTSAELRRFEVTEKRTTEEYLAVENLAGLISLVQMGVLEIHTWGSQADQIDKPDRLIFDLDPDPSVDWPHVITAAKEVRLLLEELGLVSFLKTTGGKGLHIVVPIQRRIGWHEAKAFCHAVADFLVAAAPDRYIATMSKAARKGKIFVDYLRNDRGATAIAPYSTRARTGATVSVPIGWEELNGRLKSDHFTIQNLPQRLSKLKNNPWAEIFEIKQSITAAMMRKLKTH
jgi:bifunctional non-homologous end joining protein LigD